MDELEVMRVRDEVLQAMYWMHSEAISKTPTAKELSGFLAVPEHILVPFLQRFVEDGLLECDADCWCHDSPEAAAECLHDRTGSTHSH